jgi:hypothetical protein
MTLFTPGQRVLAEGKPATVLAEDHPFTQWCKDCAHGLVCVELDVQDMPPRCWRRIPGVIPYSLTPHRFRQYAPPVLRDMQGGK